MKLIPILKKTSPRAHMELKLDVLGVHEKLVKYVVHLSKRKEIDKKFIFSSYKLSKLQLTNFWFKRILGVKFIFHIFFKELLHVALWLKLPMG